MECAGKGSRTPCCGLPIRRCQRCQAVAYCSLSHQVLHRSAHKRECERLEQQMRRAHVLNDFPFTFTREATQIQGSRCSFLIRLGVHHLGMWMCECSCGGVSANSFDSPRLISSWDLSSELSPCKGPSSPIPIYLTTWKDYYEWRCIPLHSPAALLLHWPLMIYRAIQLATLESLLPEIPNELRIHYLDEIWKSPNGVTLTWVSKIELLNLNVTRKRTSSVGSLRGTAGTSPRSKGSHRPCWTCNSTRQEPASCFAPKRGDGEKIDLYTYAQCNNIGCGCQYSADSYQERIKTCHSPAITLRLLAGCYHNRCEELLQDSFPHIVIAPNAGVAAYMSWLPTLEVIKKLKVPAVFSDYCEEACHLAASCIRSVTGNSPRIQIQMNPFRQPLCVEESALYLPCYSNCFLFGV